MNAQVQAKIPWSTVRLGDVATTSSGGTPKRSVSSYYNGDIPWVKSGELGDRIVYDTEEKISQTALEQSSAKLFPKGTLCVALYGATVGKLGILGIDAATNQAVCGIFLPEFIDTRFAYRFLESKRRELIEMGKGGAQSNISQEIIRNLEFPLLSVDEQKRIVAEIEKQFTRIDAGVAALRRMQANLKRYRAAVLKAACEGRLVPTEAELAKAEGRTYETGEQLLARILANRRKNWKGRGKYKDPAAPDTIDLPPLPGGWVCSTMAQLSFLDVGFAFKSAEFSNSGVRLLRGENVEPGRTRWLDTRYWPTERLDGFRQLLLHEGEIVLAMDRPLIAAGLKIARVRAQDLPCLLVQRVARFRPVLEQMTPFLFVVMNTVGFVKHLLGGQTGTQLPHVSGEGIQSFSIALPPFAEQKRIVDEVERRLSVVEELEATVAANLQRATRLRQSILQRAFSGKDEARIKNA